MITGAPPTAWAMGMPEFLITDLRESLAFRTGVLGFRIACSRPEQTFVCLEHPDGAQRMMDPRDGAWEMGAMERPFRRGVVFQVHVSDVDAMVWAVIGAGLPFCVQPRARWRHWGDRLGGQSEFLVQDPDGFLGMVAQRIGEKPLD
jgi:catechol 2,3-dioxygenase-like lactoylglutathione lyase family enzyme